MRVEKNEGEARKDAHARAALARLLRQLLACVLGAVMPVPQLLPLRSRQRLLLPAPLLQLRLQAAASTPLPLRCTLSVA